MSSLRQESARPSVHRRLVSVLGTGFVRLRNRLLQLLALYSPGATSVRVALHRMRGIQIGHGVFIGTAAILETEHPELIEIGSDVVIGIRTVIVAHFKGKLGVKIEDESFIGPGVIVLPGVTVGRGAVLAAGSVVTKSVRPHTMVQGNPAKVVAVCGVPLTRQESLDRFQRHLRPVRPRR